MSNRWIKKFLGKEEYDNLICQDIICHGVPSNLFGMNTKKIKSKK